MQKELEILYSAFATGVGIKLLPVIEATVQPKSLALVITALAGALLFVFLRLLSSIPMQFPQIRRYLDSKYGIEGYWFEVVDNTDTHPYSFGWIRFSPKTGRFQYKGRNFKTDLSIHARWQSSAVVTDDGTDRIHFLFEADLVKGADSIRGHGVLEFSHYIGKVFTSGSGSFIDAGATLKRRTFAAERVSGKFVKKVLGRSSIETDDDVKNVVKAMVKEKKLVCTEVEDGAN